jgi:hypothetical protein
MSGVIGVIFCESQDIFEYQNKIEGQFLSPIGHFDHFSWEKTFISRKYLMRKIGTRLFSAYNPTMPEVY